jgi:superfamily I DNA and/or RNA helicase
LINENSKTKKISNNDKIAEEIKYKKNENTINEKESNNENNDTYIQNEEEYISTLKNYKFAIICPYKSQVNKFRELKKTDKFFNNQKINDIEINTVDSFQGQERDIIIFSTVRANFKDENVLEDGEIPSSSPEQSIQTNNGNIGIGFLNDFRRMNVGLSRAKVGCFVIGHFETLKNNSYWKKLMNYCKSKKSFFQVEQSKESESIKNILK